MKKRLVVMLVAILILSTMAAGVANARASLYLRNYDISMSAEDNCKIRVTYFVEGTGEMTKIGAQTIVVEKRNGTAWEHFQTYRGDSRNDFYSYATDFHKSSFIFTGVPGNQYRATLVSYAGNSSGSDVGDDKISNSATCRY